MNKRLTRKIADLQVQLIDQNPDLYLENAYNSVKNLHIPSNNRYTKKHMWIYTEANRRYSLVGPTDVMTWRFRQVREVHLSTKIIQVRHGEIIGEIIGVSTLDQRNTTLPIISPLSGPVNPVNTKLLKHFLRRGNPDLIRIDPYNDGWLMGILAESDTELENLLDAKSYRDYLYQIVKKDPTALFQFSDSEVAAANPSRFEGIFISYRRADSGTWAHQLAKKIERYYGSLGIYLDVASNRPGRDYRKVIESHLERTNVVVAIIGPKYFVMKDKNGHTRIHTRNDTVRTELRTALQLGKMVCPMLVDDADDPEPSYYPEDLRELAYHHIFKVNSEDDLDHFVASLRPDIMGEHAGEIPKPGEHAIPGIWKTFRENEHDDRRIRTATTYQLIEMGWLLDSGAAETSLRHPDFPQYRLRFDDSAEVVWLEVYQERRWRHNRWLPAHSFLISSATVRSPKLLTLPKDLLKAAANPDVFLDTL